MSKKYYLDANFASQTFPEIWEKASDFQLQYRSNPDASYQYSPCREKIMRAFAQITQAIGADVQDYIYCTSSHSQNVIAIFHAIYTSFIRPTGKNVVLISAFDINTERALRQFIALGCVIKKIYPNKKGQITVKEIEDAISPKTACISLPFADPTTGIVYPIWDIGEYCRKMGIFFHVEVSQILSQMIFPFSDLSVDFLSFDGCHIYGLSGIGVCFVKRDISISGIWVETNRCSATSLLVALGFALHILSSSREYTCLEIARYKSILEKNLINTIPSAQIVFPRVEQLSNTTVIAFPGIYNETLLYALYERGVHASIGNLGYESIEQILSTSSEVAHFANQSIHFSLPIDIGEADLAEISQRIISSVESLRSVSGIL